ncbi:MAG: hypothetical protein HYX60_05130 [Legionella longbeachae]|nr:hypothetical protein [Legionella longbeachae]
MLLLAIVLFLAAAVCGIVMLIAILQDKAPNKIAKILHGIFAATGLIILIVYLFSFMSGRSSLLIASVVLLCLAALGGLTLFSMDRKGKKIPKMVAIVHPIIAFAGLVVLIIYVLP